MHFKLGFVKLPSYAAYWTTNSLIEIKGHKKVIYKNRFLPVLMFVHLVGFISPYKYNRKVDLTLLIRSPVKQKIPVSSTVIGRR